MITFNKEGFKPLNIMELLKRELATGRLYVVAALTVLFITSVVWATLGAVLQQGNADQLANTYLFEHWNTFQNATMPSAHSFLLKWPLFLLMQLIGPSNAHFILLTVVITLITVAALVYILYKIDKRPLIFGTLVLALASILLMIPPMPAAGGLLPVNMAMLATRNLEYVLYVGSLALMIRSKKFTDRGFWYGIGGVALLIASDKLFLFLSLGAAVVSFIIYACLRQRTLMRLVLRWTVLAVLAATLATATLWAINASSLTHLSPQTTGGPYGLVHSTHSLVLGTVFAVLSLLTNFGANPAYDTGVVAHLIGVARTRMFSLEGVSYAVNLALLGAGLYLTGRFIKDSFKRSERERFETDTATKLSLLLLWSTLAAIGAFIVTDHYYAADARYLGISLFAVVITAATYIRNHDLNLTNKLARIVPTVLMFSVIIGLLSTIGTYQTDKSALAYINNRNSLVAAAVMHHPVSVLVGDYWRVLPIKQLSTKPLQVMPMQACTNPRQVLSSLVWQPDLNKHSFAYLLSLDKGLTDYPVCSLAQILLAYGRPNASIVISGSPSNPRELLLFYDKGIQHKPVSVTVTRPITTIAPISLAQLPHLACNNSHTIMNIVAHEDDDLLFMNPDISRRIAAGDCVRTVYLTAGDAGQNQLYWLSREQGSQAAYDYMDGPAKDIWIQRTVMLSSHAYVTVSNPRGNGKVSLIFFHLPDGNINGRGFAANHNESLAKLEAGQIPLINSVDGQSTYTSTEIVQAISQLIQAFKPTEINTQATYSPSKQFVDHSDHMAVGRYVERANKLVVSSTAVVNYYYGYSVRTMPRNVEGQELAGKVVAFLDYISRANDTGCSTSNSCLELPTYGAYLRHQYSYTLPN